MTIDERISTELRRHAPDVDERAAWERFQSAAPTRHRVWARRLVPVVAAALGVVLLGFALVQTFPWDPAPVAAMQSPFRGSWFTVDGDGGTVTMTVEVSTDGVIEITALDDSAPVCLGAPSTITGTGRLEGDTRLVIPAPVLTCDDGTEPQSLNGESLEDILRDLTFTHDAESETLTDSLGSVWVREGAEDPNPNPSPEPEASVVWPQASLEEVQEAQRLADAGDPAYTWQVDPDLGWKRSYEEERQAFESSEIVARFLREELGWEEFRYWPDESSRTTFGKLNSNAFIRCAPNSSNPLYPDDPVAGDCAPTIDETHYEYVSIDLAQLGALTDTATSDDPSGIWVVSGWRMLPSLEQQRPPSEAETAALLEAFLQARIDSDGAEGYVEFEGLTAHELPLVYATSTGVSYERFEFEVTGRPAWPNLDKMITVRLFAEGDQIVVEQRFVLHGDAGRLRLVYSDFDQPVAPTSENGQPVPVRYGLMDDKVTFAVPWPWYREDQPEPNRVFGGGGGAGNVWVLTNPRAIEAGCHQGPVPDSAEALAGSLQTDPDFEVTAPVAGSLGRTPAIRMDVVVADGASTCGDTGSPLILGAGETQLHFWDPENLRMRVYLADIPGEPGGIVAFVISAVMSDFDQAVQSAAPILDSFEFYTG
jgi:hypothetical protein